MVDMLTIFPVNDAERGSLRCRSEPAVAVLFCAEKQQFSSVLEIVLLHW